MIRILTGDCRAILPTLESGSVQCAVTSPPYLGLRDYGVDGQIGLEPSAAEYITEIVGVFRELWRVMRDDAVAWLNLGDSYNSIGHKKSSSGYGTTGLAGGIAQEHHPVGREIGDRTRKHKDLLMIPARVALALQADGWWIRSDVIWHKPNPMPESVTDRPTSSHEHVFLLTKAAMYFYDGEAVRETGSENSHGGEVSNAGPKLQPLRRDGGALGIPAGTRNLRNVWTINSHPFPESHFATFPPELAERCIKAGTSERGACSACGAPWVRIVTKGAPDEAQRAACGADANGGYNGQSTKNHAAAGVQDASAVKTRILAGMRERTSEWRASCRCGAPTRPCVVLDPFAGAGTSLMVADRLGRDALGIELNPEYVQMIERRLTRDAGLFAEFATS